MTISDSTQQLIDNYHDASRRLEACGRQAPDVTSDEMEQYCRLSSATRQILTRCLLLDDPESLIHLFVQCSILLKILGQPNAADASNQIGIHLLLHYKRFGTF